MLNARTRSSNTITAAAAMAPITAAAQGSSAKGAEKVTGGGKNEDEQECG